MTKPLKRTRRDADVKNSSVITGLRLEPELAHRLVESARKAAEKTNPRTGRPIADVATHTRDLLRQHFKVQRSDDVLGDRPPAGMQGSPIAGLKLDPPLAAAIRAFRGSRLGIAGSVRHALRLALGWTVEDSLRQERKFAEIAASKRELFEA